RTVRLTVGLGPLSGTCMPPAGEVDVPYVQACKPAGGLPAYTCSVSGGAPPAGVTLGGDCTITGTPTTAGTKAFTTRIADSAGLAVTISSSVTIRPHVAVITSVLPKAPVNRFYSATLAATGGVRPFAWAVVAGSLPT